MTFPKYFTLEEARVSLPWLRNQLGDIAAARQELLRLQPQMESLLRAVRTNGHGDTDARLAATRRAMEQVTERLSRLAGEVQERGIILRDPQRGLVDFPSWRGGRVVFLCWVSGEVDITYWHDIDAGIAGRQPL